jgi:cell division protein FtsB
MKRLFEHRYLVRKNLVTLIGMGLLMYFSYHLVQGERSYIRYISLNQSIATLTQEAADMQKERHDLETRVAMMRPGSINRDLLEERARVVLGFRREGEKDILPPQN